MTARPHRRSRQPRDAGRQNPAASHPPAGALQDGQLEQINHAATGNDTGLDALLIRLRTEPHAGAAAPWPLRPIDLGEDHA